MVLRDRCRRIPTATTRARLSVATAAVTATAVPTIASTSPSPWVSALATSSAGRASTGRLELAGSRVIQGNTCEAASSRR